MPFRYSCFVSYRRTNQTIVERFVRDLKEALSYELAPLLDLDVFLDVSGVEAGQQYEQALATALCQSVAMVVVYTPTYFSESYPQCAREFKAMEKLENQRLKALGRSEQGGLIIPVVLRGADRIPDELRRRQYYNFDRFLLGDTRIYRSPGFRHSIADIAESIYRSYEAFRRLGNDASAGCESFRLPSLEDVRPWLLRVTMPAAPSPLRKEDG